MTFIGLLGGYFTLFVAGMGLALILLKSANPINAIEYACLSWLLGVGVVSLSLWLAGIVLSGVALQSLVALICLALGIFGWRTRRLHQIRFSLPRPNNPTEWVLATLLLLEIATIFFVSLKHTLGWDGLLNWEIKARYAFLNSGVLPQSYYSNAGRAFSHPEYPLGLPFTELWLYLWMGAAHQFWIKTIFPFFYGSGALLLALFVSRLTGKRWVGLFIALLIPFLPFVLASPGGIAVGYADIPLSIYYVTALGYLLCSITLQTKRYILAYAAMLSLIPWIKSEGIILWGLLAFFGLLVGFFQNRIRPFLFAVAPGFLIVPGWRVYLKAMHCTPPADFARPTLQLLRDNADRLPTICRIALAELSDVGLWSIFWILVLVALVYLLAARNFMKLILAAALIGPIILYLLTYLFSTWPSYTAHMTSSLPRLLLQVAPVGWLAIALALARSQSKPSNTEARLG